MEDMQELKKMLGKTISETRPQLSNILFEIKSSFEEHCELIGLRAKLNKKLYDECISAGFTKEQSMQILIAKGS